MLRQTDTPGRPVPRVGVNRAISGGLSTDGIRLERERVACTWRVQSNFGGGTGQAQGLSLQNGEGIAEGVRAARPGQAQGLPLQIRCGGCGGSAGSEARAGTRPAPTEVGWGLRRGCGGFRGQGRHKACPYRTVRGLRRRRGQRGQGRHKACPYRYDVGVAEAPRVPRPGQAQGLPLQIRCGGCGGSAGSEASAGTRPAPTEVGWGLRRGCGGFRGQGRHKACPYRTVRGLRRLRGFRGQGRHKACPYRTVRGLRRRRGFQGQGRHKACPYRTVRGLRRRRGFRGQGRHKACPYRTVRGLRRRRRFRGQGRHKACPYRTVRGLRRRRGGFRGQGRHKACPYGNGEGIAEAARRVPRPGQAQGLPLRKRGGDCGGGAAGSEARAGTRPATTETVRGLRRLRGFRGQGRHKACPYGNGEGITEAARRVLRPGQAQGLPLRKR